MSNRGSSGVALLATILAVAMIGTGQARAGVVTLPAAASIQGGAPFYTDVRAFNTSYKTMLTVTATYQCFVGKCPSTSAQFIFTLLPRESREFDDMIASGVGFHSPDSGGAVEFSFVGPGDLLVVTSRLYSTSPSPTVGMFIPALQGTDAHITTVLTSVRNGGAGAGFRTNVGVFNPGLSSVTVNLQIYDQGAPAGSPVTLPSVAGHSGAQVNAIFTAAGVPQLSTESATIVVTASGPIFSYAAVIDNATTDPIFVVGAEDRPTTPLPTSTPTPPPPTPTGAPLPPTPTPTPPLGGTQVVAASSDEGTQFIDTVSGTSTSTITVGTKILWISISGVHSTTSGPCPPCTADGLWDSGEGFETFEYTFTQTGTFPYFCTVHGAAMTGTVIVNP
jgi:plastocyanin